MLLKPTITYGCFNRREFDQIVAVQDGWYQNFMSGWTREASMKSVPFTMARDCQYTKTALGQADSKCQGCKHRLDI